MSGRGSPDCGRLCGSHVPTRTTFRAWSVFHLQLFVMSVQNSLKFPTLIPSSPTPLAGVSIPQAGVIAPGVIPSSTRPVACPLGVSSHRFLLGVCVAGVVDHLSAEGVASAAFACAGVSSHRATWGVAASALQLETFVRFNQSHSTNLMLEIWSLFLGPAPGC